MVSRKQVWTWAGPLSSAEAILQQGLIIAEDCLLSTPRNWGKSLIEGIWAAHYSVHHRHLTRGTYPSQRGQGTQGRLCMGQYLSFRRIWVAKKESGVGACREREFLVERTAFSKTQRQNRQRRNRQGSDLKVCTTILKNLSVFVKGMGRT